MIKKPIKESRIDHEVEDTFPASDPPSWMGNAAVPGKAKKKRATDGDSLTSREASGHNKAGRPDGTDQKQYSKFIKPLQKETSI